MDPKRCDIIVGLLAACSRRQVVVSLAAMIFSALVSLFGRSAGSRADGSSGGHFGAGAIIGDGGGRRKRKRLRLRRRRDDDRDKKRKKKHKRTGGSAGGVCSACTGDTLACLDGVCMTCPATCPSPCTACYNGPDGTVCAKFANATPRVCTTNADCTPSHPHCAHTVVSAATNTVIPFPMPPPAGKGHCMTVVETG